jgi:hypothetical protein
MDTRPAATHVGPARDDRGAHISRRASSLARARLDRAPGPPTRHDGDRFVCAELCGQAAQSHVDQIIALSAMKSEQLARSLGLDEAAMAEGLRAHLQSISAPPDLTVSVSPE